MSNYYITNDELYHYGVKGMKWGVRKKGYEQYKNAKKTLKDERKAYRKNVGLGIGYKGIRKAEKARSRYLNAEMNFISEKAKYKTANAKNKDKAEMRTYVKEMRKSGLPGSAADSSGRSKKLYSKISKEKGKDYAEQVVKKTQRKIVSDIATAAAVSAGTSFVMTLLASNN